jgi:predicted  nucleic acid-binding Zn-ribbon protein
MGNETEKFTALEEKLNKVLESYIALKKEKERLSSQVGGGGEEVKRLREEITRLKQEHSEARKRIERLLEKLERIPLEG